MQRRLVFTGALVILCSGCTRYVPLSYQATPGGEVDSQIQGVVKVAAFQDERGIEADYLGAIRGGYYNRLKVLRSVDPVSEVVTKAFEDALRARGLLAEDGNERFVLTGSVKQLHSNYYFNRTAIAEFRIRMRRSDSNDSIYEGTFTSSRGEGTAAIGIFGSLGRLRSLVERTMNDAIDKALDAPEFRRALAQAEKTDLPEGGDAADRLRRLDALKDQGLISDEEYKKLRQQIIDGL